MPTGKPTRRTARCRQRTQWSVARPIEGGAWNYGRRGDAGILEGAMARAIHVFRTPDRFVAGTIGQPGNRTFYLQAVHDKRVISVVLEKQQVAVLAERIAALLLEINRRFGTPIPPDPGDRQSV